MTKDFVFKKHTNKYKQIILWVYVKPAKGNTFEKSSQLLILRTLLVTLVQLWLLKNNGEPTLLAH